MTHHALGARFDLHSGGVDLKFPHHNNEIAQCEAHSMLRDGRWVRHWMHTGHLYIQGPSVVRPRRTGMHGAIAARRIMAKHVILHVQRHAWLDVLVVVVRWQG
jgi:cysteinyl-tRNA synthetase